MSLSLLFWVILIGLLLWLGRFLRQRWTTAQIANPAAATTSVPATAPVGGTPAADPASDPAADSSLINTLQRRLTALRTNLLGPKQPAQTANFRSWIAQSAPADPRLQGWLLALTDEQLHALEEHIARFCLEMGFELTWLLTADLTHYPALAQALSAVVHDYCHACYQSVQVQADLTVYKAWRSYQQNPQTNHNRAFGQALFGKLVEDAVVPIRVSDHMALPERERQSQIIETISWAAAEKPLLFQRLLKELVVSPANGMAGAPTSATPNGKMNTNEQERRAQPAVSAPPITNGAVKA